MNRKILWLIMTLACCFTFCGCQVASNSQGEVVETFNNPLLESGADPWVFYLDGFYYYIKSANRSLVLLKTADITELATAEKQVIWHAPTSGDHSQNLWAPEIHFIDGAWYVYFAADDGNHHNHRMFVLENTERDPFAGKFKMKSRLVTDPADNWAIDGSVFRHKGQLYMIWSGWQSPKVDIETARIYIAKMSDPWTISTDRVELSKPELSWERNWDYPDSWTPDNPIYVNEGPQMLSHGTKMHIVYSCSGCWTPYYALGMLTADIDSDPMDPESWQKSPEPVFMQSLENGVYATGHNCFFKSPDGSEDWILYHANDNPNDGCGSTRSPRAQKVQWLSDDMPDFGEPVSTSKAIAKPSGTK